MSKMKIMLTPQMKKRRNNFFNLQTKIKLILILTNSSVKINKKSVIK